MIRALIDSMIAYAKATHGWSQAEFAARAGLTPEGLSRAKGGCQGSTLVKMAEALGGSIIFVPGGDDYLNKLARGTLLGDLE